MRAFVLPVVIARWEVPPAPKPAAFEHFATPAVVDRLMVSTSNVPCQLRRLKLHRHQLHRAGTDCNCHLTAIDPLRRILTRLLFSLFSVTSLEICLFSLLHPHRLLLFPGESSASSSVFFSLSGSSPTAPNGVPPRLPTDFRYSNELEPHPGSSAPCDRYRYVTCTFSHRALK